MGLVAGLGKLTTKSQHGESCSHGLLFHQFS